MAYVKFEDTDEERKIKWIVRGAWSFNSAYCFVTIDGKEAMLRAQTIAANWLDCASIEDFRRIAIY